MNKIKDSLILNLNKINEIIGMVNEHTDKINQIIDKINSSKTQANPEDLAANNFKDSPKRRLGNDI